jgi:protein-L-isoaspartate(D-aspartate) O-methyltransferase
VRKAVRELHVTNLKVKHADGQAGFPDAAPFDVIVMAAAAPAVPRELCDQLAVGGRLVLPVGTREQRLVLIERTDTGFDESSLEAVNFVPLIPGMAS